MTTKIGIDLPPELLEAARVTQAANRNKLSIRERQNKITSKILNDPVVTNQQIIEEQQRAVNEYIDPIASLPKLNKSLFSWMITERILSGSSEMSSAGLNTGVIYTYKYNQEANNVISTSKSIDFLAQYLDKLHTKKISVQKAPSIYYGESFYDPLGGLEDFNPFVAPILSEVELSKEEIKEQRANPQFFHVANETRFSLDLRLKHSTVSASSGSASYQSSQNNANSTGYSSTIFLFTPTSASKKLYLYVTYRSTGSFNSFTNIVKNYFVSPGQTLYTEASSDTYSGNTNAWISGNLFLNYYSLDFFNLYDGEDNWGSRKLFFLLATVNDAPVRKPTAATPYRSTVSFVRTHPSDNQYDPSFALIDLPDGPEGPEDDIRSINPSDLPSELQGLFTVMYEMPQVDSVSKVEMQIGIPPINQLLKPLVSGFGLSDGESSTGTGSSTLIYDENILFSFSDVNYAEL